MPVWRFERAAHRLLVDGGDLLLDLLVALLGEGRQLLAALQQRLKLAVHLFQLLSHIVLWDLHRCTGTQQRASQNLLYVLRRMR